MDECKAKREYYCWELYENLENAILELLLIEKDSTSIPAFVAKIMDKRNRDLRMVENE